MMTQVPGKPGLYVDAQGRVEQLSKTYEGDLLDTVGLSAGSFTVGMNRFFWNSKTNKNKQHLLMAGQVETKLPNGTAARVFRCGIHVRQSIGNTMGRQDDITKILENGYFVFKLNGSTIFSEGPGIVLPSGYGVYGNGTTTSNAASGVSNGMPLYAAAPVLAEQARVTIRQDDNLSQTELRFDDAQWFVETAQAGTGAYSAPVSTSAHAVSAICRAIITTGLGNT